MAETADYNPGAWKGHDFASARKAYDADAGRGYADATAKGVTVADCVPKNLETQSSAPLVVVCDVTGSMGEWPAVIFSKLPYLDIEGKEYLGPDMEISFGAIGDAQQGDKYPLQVRKFDTGTPLSDHLKALIVEGKGGGDACESYELAGLYYARNVKMPNATKPIMIFIGDEGLHPWIEKRHATACHIDIQGSKIDTTEIFDELTRKYSVYVVRKTYGPPMETAIMKQWVSLIGEDHVCMLESPDRVIDVIFGILAKETGKVAYFRKELEDRQRPDQVDTVYKSLKTVHAALPEKASKGKSVMHIPTGKKTKGLLGK